MTAARRVVSAGSVASSGPVAAADRVPGGSVDDLLAAARRRLHRLGPAEAYQAWRQDGALLVDIRPQAQRAAEGIVPGALHVERNVLEWRLDPRSEARIPALARADVQIIVMCSEGYASTLAAASLRRIGVHEATYLDGGFQAWKAASLPTRPAQSLG